MDRYALSDADWHRLAPLIPGRAGTRGRSGDDNRRFVIPLDDDAGLTRAMADLVADPALRATLGTANGLRARADFGDHGQTADTGIEYENMMA